MAHVLNRGHGVPESLLSDSQENKDLYPAKRFKPLKPHQLKSDISQSRRIPVPANRFTALKSNWIHIYKPIIDRLKLQIRMNTKTRHIELRTSPDTEDVGLLDRATEFIRAFLLGFNIKDAGVLLRLDEISTETFSIEDVKTLSGEHLSRAIGRIAGKDGKTKFSIENATRTRILICDRRISILGSYQNIKHARRAICDLIIGAPPGKVYQKLRGISARLKDCF